MPTRPTEQSRWFSEEVLPHEASLRAYLRARFPSLRDFDDLVQESYARLLKARERGVVSSTKSFLFATARNAALDLFRRRHVVAIDGIANLEHLPVLEDSPGAAEILNHQQELLLLAEAVESLPARCRQVLVLQKIDGLSYKEIGARLGISENTVNAQLTLGVMRCREYLRRRGVLKGRPDAGREATARG